MRWEYKVSNAPTTPRELQAVLDHDGCEEWELVTATPFASRLILLYKRPVESVQEAPCPEIEAIPETGETDVPQNDSSDMTDVVEQAETEAE